MAKAVHVDLTLNVMDMISSVNVIQDLSREFNELKTVQDLAQMCSCY